MSALDFGRSAAIFEGNSLRLRRDPGADTVALVAAVSSGELIVAELGHDEARNIAWHLFAQVDLITAERETQPNNVIPFAQCVERRRRRSA